MSKENLKLLVGGYFDDRIFEGEYFEGKTPFNSEIDTYTLEEAYKLGFCEEENVKENYFDLHYKYTNFEEDLIKYAEENSYKLEELENIDHSDEDFQNWYWNNYLTYKDKCKIVEKYTERDERAGLLYFETEKESESYKKDVLKELEELENEIEYAGKKQDREGNYREVYIKDSEEREARLIVNKSGSGSTTFRATLPQTWIRKMGLGEKSRDLLLSFDGEKIIIENNEEEVKMLNKNFVKLGLEELDYIMDSPNYTTTQVDDLNNSDFRSYLEKELEKVKSEEEIKPLIEKMLIEFFDEED